LNENGPPFAEEVKREPDLAQRHIDAAEMTAATLTEIASTLQNIELYLSELLELKGSEEEE
jgi:hypothetical protein